MTWISTPRAAALARHLAGQGPRQTLAVDGLDHVEQGHGLARLVALQAADHVQLDAVVAQAQVRPARGRLLHVVLAETALPGRQRRLDPVEAAGPC